MPDDCLDMNCPPVYEIGVIFVVGRLEFSTDWVSCDTHPSFCFGSAELRLFCLSAESVRKAHTVQTRVSVGNFRDAKKADTAAFVSLVKGIRYE